MKIGVPAGGACRLTRSMPGRNHHAPGTGGEESTGTDLPIGSRARASASAEPSVSPSASLCVTAVTTGASSITCQIRGATSATSGRGGASSAAGVWLPLLDFTQKLAHPDAVGDSLVQLEMQLRGEAEVRQARAQLAPDEALRVIQAVNRRLARIVLADDAHLDRGIAKIRTELHLADRRHPDPGILEVTDDDLTDFLAQLCGDAFNSMSAHGPHCMERQVWTSTRSESKPKAVCSTWGWCRAIASFPATSVSSSIAMEKPSTA